MVGAQSGVHQDLAPNAAYTGTPAIASPGVSPDHVRLSEAARDEENPQRDRDPPEEDRRNHLCRKGRRNR